MANAKESYEKALQAVEKQRGTIERHEKQLTKAVAALNKRGIEVALEKDAIRTALRNAAQQSQHDLYWDLCKVETKMDDIERAKYALTQKELTAQKWFEKLRASEKMQAVFDELPAVIMEFAAGYKKRVKEWLLEGVTVYRERLAEAEAITDREERNRARAAVQKAFSGTIQNLSMVAPWNREEEADKIAERQRIDLLKTLSFRVAEKVGRITDAAGLEIGMNGEINGYVEGDKGGANIQTILAGGWNIQCLHFRVLVK